MAHPTRENAGLEYAKARKAERRGLGGGPLRTLRLALDNKKGKGSKQTTGENIEVIKRRIEEANNRSRRY